jgi:RNA polymerase sigma factor (sigma-70 family)
MDRGEEEFQALMQRVREGSEEAVQELVCRYGPHIQRVVRRKLLRQLRRQFDSVDFVQSVWKSFFTVPGEQYTFDSPEALIAFLARVAQNKVLETYQGQLRTQKRGGARTQSLAGLHRHRADELDPRQPTPSQIASADEQWQHLLAGMPPHHQRILVLLRHGYEVQEIAEQLGVSIKTVRRLRKKLVEDGHWGFVA